MAAQSSPAKRLRGGPINTCCGWFDLDSSDRIHEIDRKHGNPLLARGAFGDVSIAMDVENGWRLAVVKTIPQATTSTGSPWDRNTKRVLAKELLNEILALRMLSPHPNIVSFLGLFLSKTDTIPGSLSLAFHYSPLDLDMLLEKRERLLPICICKTMARDILTAVQHCHLHGILHRDVKPGNLLISSEGRLLLCDFGLAKPSPSLLASTETLPGVDPNGTDTKGMCTLWYRPPEVLLGGPSNHASVDIYSAGLVVSELITGRVLFKGEGVLDQLGRIFSILGTPTATHWPDAQQLPDFGKVTFQSKEPQSLIQVMPRIAEVSYLSDWLSCLVCLDPNNRFTAIQALQHEWFTSSLPPAASYKMVAQEVIPRELREPSVLFSSLEVNDTTMTVARNKILDLAQARRTFFESGPLPPRRTLVDACQALPPI